MLVGGGADIFMYGRTDTFTGSLGKYIDHAATSGNELF